MVTISYYSNRPKLPTFELRNAMRCSMRRLIALLVIIATAALLLPIDATSQDFAESVIGNYGGQSKIPGVTLDWTIGETVIETFPNQGVTLLQGFHKGDMLLLTGTDPEELEEFGVYPNPVRDFLTVETLSKVPFILFNVIGQEVFHGIAEGKILIDFRDLAAGMYILRLDERVSYKLLTIGL